MASVASNNPSSRPDDLGAAQAMRLAWWAWVIMLATPFFVFMATILYLLSAEAPWVQGPGTLGFTWFVVAVAYMLIVVPASFFWQSRFFRAYYVGNAVQPRAYLRGKLVVWGALEFGGIFSLVGCIVSGSLLPCLIPALVAFMFFVVLWPNGQSMREGMGDTDDPQAYREPR